MPLPDIFATFFDGGDRHDGRDGRDGFHGPPRSNLSGDDELDGMSTELESMLHMMDHMMSHAFRDFDVGFQRSEPHGSFGGGPPRDPFLPNQPPQSGKSLRHQFLRNVDDDTAEVGDSSPESPSPASNLTTTEERHSGRGVQMTWRPLTSLFPDIRSWPSDLPDSSRHPVDDVVDSPGRTPADIHMHEVDTGPSSRPVVCTTVYSSSSVRHADGSVETKTYNRDASGQEHITHTRQSPDQRTVTTYEEKSRDGTVSTRDEFSSGIKKTSPETNGFSTAWQRRTAPDTRDSTDLQPASFSSGQGIDWMKDAATRSWNFAKSWFR